jgi:hypothetical protein
LAAKLFRINLKEILSRYYFLDAWFLMFDFNEHISVPPLKFKEMLPPKGKFWADPMVIQNGDCHYVFIEEYDYTRSKGHISVIKIDPQGNFSQPELVLDQPYHLSYPCVFEWNERYYLIPESAEHHTIDLYECVEFPDKWKFKMCLMENVSAVDTTVFYEQGKWWMFTGLAENEGAFPEVELFLFSADTLFTKEWRAHPRNPIVSDVNNARPAGKIFRKDGKLFRPAQNGSITYGFGIHLNQILLLSESDYREETVVSITPNWDKKVLATHTYGSEGNLNIVDAHTRRHRFF